MRRTVIAQSQALPNGTGSTYKADSPVSKQVAAVAYRVVPSIVMLSNACPLPSQQHSRCRIHSGAAHMQRLGRRRTQKKTNISNYNALYSGLWQMFQIHCVINGKSSACRKGVIYNGIT